MGIDIPIWGPMRYVVLGPKWGSLPSSSELKVSGTHRPLGILLAKISGVLEVKREVVTGTKSRSLQTHRPDVGPGCRGPSTP